MPQSSDETAVENRPATPVEAIMTEESQDAAVESVTTDEDTAVMSQGEEAAPLNEGNGNM